MGNCHRNAVRNDGDAQTTSTHAEFPRIFISYRRAHSGWAKAIQLELKRLGYPDAHVFFDLDRESGLEAGPFQTQLKQSVPPY